MVVLKSHKFVDFVVHEINNLKFSLQQYKFCREDTNEPWKYNHDNPSWVTFHKVAI